MYWPRLAGATVLALATITVIAWLWPDFAADAWRQAGLRGGDRPEWLSSMWVGLVVALGVYAGGYWRTSAAAGLATSLAALIGLTVLWFDLPGLLRGTWFTELRLIVMAVATLVLLAVLERIWGFVAPGYAPRDSLDAH